MTMANRETEHAATFPLGGPVTRTRTLGSWSGCDLVLEGETVAPIHAQAQLTADGHIEIVDAGSDHGTWLNRNQQWIRVLKVDLGRRDRIRLGEQEVDIARLVELFGDRLRVRLRDIDTLRLPQRLKERLEAVEARVEFERPRRNPETGNIEEDR
jgi:hypothetical protein